MKKETKIKIGWVTLWTTLAILLIGLLTACAQSVPDYDKPHVVYCDNIYANSAFCPSGREVVYEKKCHLTVWQLLTGEKELVNVTDKMLDWTARKANE